MVSPSSALYESRHTRLETPSRWTRRHPARPQSRRDAGHIGLDNPPALDSVGGAGGWSMSRTIGRLVVVLAFAALLPANALAQTGSIAGVVRDTSGAVMPGVTVEAA